MNVCLYRISVVKEQTHVFTLILGLSIAEERSLVEDIEKDRMT